ncbi:MAG: PEP-CTERM sorting domain-containing protein, partial [Planctomycetota bacterium]
DFNGTDRSGTLDVGAYVYDPAGNPGRAIGPWLKLPPWHVGDANGDGEVGIADLSVLADHYGRVDAGWAQGDFTGDRVVGVADLSALADNYGWAGAGASVPEPATLAMLSAAWAVLDRRRRRPRRG